MPRATGTSGRLARYEEAWESINRLIRRGGTWSGEERDCFYAGLGDGRFVNVSAAAGLDDSHDGRAVSVVDLDLDGDEDLVLKSRTGPQLQVLRNDLPRRNARVLVRLVGTRSNRDAVGARVVVEAGGRTEVRERRAGSGFLSQNGPRLVFGLGSARRVDRLEVRWPSGGRQVVRDLPVDRRIVLREGDDAPEVRRFRRLSGGGATRPAPPPRQRSAPGAASRVWLLDPLDLPELGLRTLAGRALPSGRTQGPLVLHLWTPECPVCVRELRAWGESRGAADSNEPAGSRAALPVLAAVPEGVAGRSAGRLRGIAERTGIPLVRLPERSLRALVLLLEQAVRSSRELAVPASLLVGADGRVQRVYRGPVEWETFRADLDRLRALHRAGRRRARWQLALPFPGRYHVFRPHRDPYRLGTVWLEAGLDEHALAAFDEALRQAPGHAEAFYNKGVIHLRRGELDRAGDAFARALEEAPEFVDALVNLGVVAARRGRREDAATFLRRAVELRPQHAEALLDLGVLELGRGRPEAALAWLERAVEAGPGLAPAHEQLGRALLEQGDLRGALRAHERAVELDRGSAERWGNLAVLRARAGRPQAALAACDEALRLEPERVSAINNRGLVLESLGRAEAARAAFRRALEIAPDAPAPRLNLARSWLQAGDEDRARRELRELLDRVPGHSAARDLLRRLEGERRPRRDPSP